MFLFNHLDDDRLFIVRFPISELIQDRDDYESGRIGIVPTNKLITEIKKELLEIKRSVFMPIEEEQNIIETTIESTIEPKTEIKENTNSKLETPHDYNIWTNSSGVKVPIKNMEEEYIVNAMYMICRSFSRKTLVHKPKFGEKFTYSKGIGYLIAFAMELTRRQTITEI